MRLSTVVRHLRQYCPSFDGRVAVSMEFKHDRGQVRMTVPAAVVMPGGDDAEVSLYENATVQEVDDRFIVVAIVQTADAQRGDESSDLLHDLRAELWRALIGWTPGDGYEPVEYLGGEVSHMDRAVTYYTMHFTVQMTVGHAAGVGPGRDPETWQEYELAGLPSLDGLDVKVDVIEPIADRNLKRPGPDGRTEFQLHEEVKP